MSASDAAPLPRLGEVFFDVRGSSRSMRLSWYADTGVAVFSIWQGGMCTGTFRLPMDDLARMIEVLQSGPQRPHAVPAAGYADGDYGEAADYGDADYGESRDYGEGPDYGTAEYAPPAYRSASPGRGDADYGEAGYDRTAAYRVADQRDAEYGRPQDYQPDATGQRYVPPAGAGYDQQRFVPPYVRPQGESYGNDNPPGRAGHRRDMRDQPYPADQHGDSAAPEPYQDLRRAPAGYPGAADYRLPADTDAGARHSAGRHGGQPPGPARGR